MPTFALEIEYLTGYAVATYPNNREQPEWPPHPGRVFMALAAAHFETCATDDEKREGREALEWLASLPPPAMSIPDATPRSTLTVYVPVNDVEGREALPTFRSRQPRTFPRVHVGSQPLRLIWQGDEETGRHLPALRRITQNVTRIGHSSSLVWVRVVENAEQFTATHAPVPNGLDERLRIVTEGELERLERAANFEALTTYRQLEHEAQNAKGKQRKELKAALAKQFPAGEPPSRRPTLSISVSYSPVSQPMPQPSHSCFDDNFIVLSEHDENTCTLGLESTLQVLTALRGAILSKFGNKPIPAWVSGHEADGSKLVSGNHLALFPLPFVHGGHGDGHLLGLGIAIPRDVPLRDRARALSPLLFNANNEPAMIELTLGKWGVYKVRRETSVAARLALRTTTWTSPAQRWRSVTPIVLDRIPKTERRKDPFGWREEVAGIIAAACERIGLPPPVAVRIEKTPLVRGSLRAMPGQGGFPLLRNGVFQIHAELTFGEPVLGPVLVGAGRFRGYGLCRPMHDRGEA